MGQIIGRLRGVFEEDSDEDSDVDTRIPNHSPDGDYSLFARQPPEMQRQIYDAMIPGPRLIVLTKEEPYEDYTYSELRALEGEPIPPVFRLCKDSRCLATEIRKYELISGHRWHRYVNFEKDSFLLAETLELLIGECQWPAEELARRIKHLVVGIYYTDDSVVPYCKGEDMSYHIPWDDLVGQFPVLESLVIVTSDDWVSRDEDEEGLGWWDVKTDRSTELPANDPESEDCPWWKNEGERNDDYCWWFRRIDFDGEPFLSAIRDVTEQQLVVVKRRYPNWPLKSLTWLGGLENFAQ